MCTARMRARIASAEPQTSGYVLGRRFAFHKRSDDGSAKADAVMTECFEDRVWGVLFRIDHEEQLLLDRHEFLGIGYDRHTVEVIHPRGTVQATIYTARREAIDASLLPYAWYRDFVVHGAQEHRLPNAYVEYLQSFDALPDPDLARHAANRQILIG